MNKSILIKSESNNDKHIISQIINLQFMRIDDLYSYGSSIFTIETNYRPGLYRLTDHNWSYDIDLRKFKSIDNIFKYFLDIGIIPLIPSLVYVKHDDYFNKFLVDTKFIKTIEIDKSSKFYRERRDLSYKNYNISFSERLLSVIELIDKTKVGILEYKIIDLTKDLLLKRIEEIQFDDLNKLEDKQKLKRKYHKSDKRTYLHKKRPKTNSFYDHETYSEYINQFNLKKYRKMCHKIERREAKREIVKELYQS